MKLAIIGYFRPKLAHSNGSVYRTSIDRTLKCDSRGVGQFFTTNHSWVMMEILLESIVLYLEKVDTQILEDSEQFLITEQGILA